MMVYLYLWSSASSLTLLMLLLLLCWSQLTIDAADAEVSTTGALSAVAIGGSGRHSSNVPLPLLYTAGEIMLSFPVSAEGADQPHMGQETSITSSTVIPVEALMKDIDSMRIFTSSSTPCESTTPLHIYKSHVIINVIVVMTILR